MNKTVLLIFLCVSGLTLNCGNVKRNGNEQSGKQVADTGTAKIIFTEYEHDFGKVTEGEKIAYSFSMENKGTADLVVTAVTTTCGCTVPKYDSKPIAPGKRGNIEVEFDTSGRNGIQTKTITVKSNASIPVILLKITAEVVAAKE
jgi:hypothetical protein